MYTTQSTAILALCRHENAMGYYMYITLWKIKEL